MSKPSLAKISRRRFNLRTVVFSAQQEVTVPATTKIPVGTQYLLQPMLVVPKDKVTVQLGPGKVRVQGQIDGFQSCVDSDETVHTLPVPTMEFMTSFAVPADSTAAKLEADVILEGVEVDRGDDDVANITAYLLVSLWALKHEESELVTTVTGDSLSAETEGVKLQHVIKEAEIEKPLTINLPMATGNPVAKDLCIGNLSWHVVDGKLLADGIAMVKVFYMAEGSGEVSVVEGSREFELEIDFDAPEVSDSTLDCYPIKTVMSPGPEGQEFNLILWAKAVGYQEQTCDYITSVIGADSLNKSFQLRNRVGESEFKLTLDGACQFPLEPVKVEVALPKVRLIETQALDERVLVRGLLSMHIYYTDENERRRVLVQEEEFNHYLDLKGCATGYSVKAWAWPETGEYSMGSYSVPVLLRVEVSETKVLDAVTDVHVVDPEYLPVSASIVLYVTAKEDSLFSVARKFNISQEMLMQYNGLSGEDEIHPGQKLLVPVYQLKYS